MNHKETFKEKYVDDKELLSRISDGQYWAFTALYNRYIKTLTDYGLKFTNDIQLVEDCLHDLFVWIWKNRSVWHIDYSLKAYLFKSIRTAIFQKVNREKRQVAIENEENEYPFQLSISTEDQFILSETKTILKSKISFLLSLLTARQKEVIYLRYYEDLSFDEIAQNMNLSTKGCYKLMGRAIAELRKTLPQGLIFFLLLVK
jgi:RNA polymerase sigma factor (sigma-70 family)